MDNVIEIKNLVKKYPRFELKNLNLNLEKGTIMGLIGENGAGKTTTIKAILNIIHKDAGEIKIFGMDHIVNEKKVKEEIGVVLDDSFLSDYLNAKDVDKIMKNFYQHWNTEQFYQYLVDFKLPVDKMIKDFSSGMKMKLKIATALSHDPKLLILDEPTSGLDPVVRSEILDVFREFIQDEEHSILLSSHITSDLEYIADYITFINDGQIVFSKSRDELLEKYGIVKCTQEQFKTIHSNDYLKYQKNKYEYKILVSNKMDFKRKYDIDIIDKPTIDDIMLLYIKGERS